MLLVLNTCKSVLAGNACQAEIASACPERPAAEMAKCLKDKEEHDAPTEISSECADFIALNVACADDIEQFCDGGHFTDDTVLCLSEWNRHNLGSKCAKVVEWAAPKKEGSGPTDELGMSEEDYAEKRRWQAERKQGRGAAIEKMREDKQRQEEMETLKKEDPVAYKQMLKEQEEAKKSLEELKKRKRLMAAADERQRKEEAGETEEEEEPEATDGKKKGVKRRKIRESQPTGWLPYAFGGLGVLFVVANIINFFTGGKDEKKSD